MKDFWGEKNYRYIKYVYGFIKKVLKKYVDKKILIEIYEKVVFFINWLKEVEEDDFEEDEEDYVEVRLRGISVG